MSESNLSSVDRETNDSGGPVDLNDMAFAANLHSSLRQIAKKLWRLVKHTEHHERGTALASVKRDV